MSTESESSPASRLWKRVGEGPGPPLPQWMYDMWVQHGRPHTKGSERFGESGRALLWLVSRWCASRKPYRFALPADLLEWLNATELDLTTTVQYRPALDGAAPSSAFKPVSRFMRSVWEDRDRVEALADVYFDFLAEFAFSVLPASNAPAALLPGEIIELLNVPAAGAPAAGDDLPLTVGMLLHIKRAYPHEYRQLSRLEPDCVLALCFLATQDLLGMRDPRLIPASVSGFWSQRPLPGKIITAFEYVSARIGDVSGGNGEQIDETGIRNWFHKVPALKNPGVLLFSGPSGEPSTAGAPSMNIHDRAILVYRDHVTIAGLSRAGASMGSALHGTGLPVFDLHFLLGRDKSDVEVKRNRELWVNARRKLHVLHLNPEYIWESYYCNLPQMGTEDYVVGQFFWELSNISKIHEPGIALMDEIWTASRFLTHLYGSVTKKPIVSMGLAIPVKRAPALLKPEQFGFSCDTYLFLSSFDAGSVVERKNPLGTITAFQKAFPRGREPAGLIIKTLNLQYLRTEADKAHWTRALERIRGDKRIRIIDNTMTEDELLALYGMCDCFVSLHRSEGFGFGLAEAMAQGKPVIATNYSGVCDFCTPETAKLVNYELIRVKPDEYPFLDPDRIYEWADPDLNMAAEHMRVLAEDRKQSERIGRAARALMAREYSVEALRNRYFTRLEQLGFGPRAELECSAAAC